MLIVVCGPPASGKSSWVRAHAKPTDVVIDLDLMAQAMAGPGADTHHHGEQLLHVVHKARYAAINAAQDVVDKVDVYLIHTQPSAKARAKYKRMGARMVTVDPGRDVVMQRIRDMRRPGMEAVATRWYNAWRKGGSRPVTTQASRSW